jgi:predicted permease
MGLAPGYIFDALEAPLPVEDGQRVLGLRYWSIENSAPAATTAYDLAVWRETLRSFEALGAVREVEQNLDPGTGVGQAVHGAEITASAFAALRVRPALGRLLTAEDQRPGAPRVVVLGQDVWRSRLAGDPDAIGRTVRIAGVPYTVVGVMPEGFFFPRRESMWLPFRGGDAPEPGVGPSVLVFGRLATGAGRETAQVELTAVGQRLALDRPNVYGRLRAEVVSFAAAASGWPRGGLRARPQVRLIQLPALMLLLVACLNVGLLILARSATRAAEFAVRTALGASRMRIVTQVFAEALVLSLVAAGLGTLLLSVVMQRLLDPAWSSSWTRLPYWAVPDLSLGTLSWVLVLAALSAAAVSILPALQVTGRGVAADLRHTGGGGSGLRFGGKATVLIVVDLAVAVAVVGAAAGMGDKIDAVLGQGDPSGIAADRYLAAGVRLPQNDPLAADSVEGEGRTTRMALLEQALVERLGTEPQVTGIAIGSALPGMDHSRRYVEVDGRLDAIDRAWVRPGFFEAFDRPVVAGRAFRPGDLDGDRPAVVVNIAFQEEVLGGRNPLGLLLRYPTSGDGSPSYEIVGVAPNLGADPLNPSGGAAVYHPVGPGELTTLRMAIRLGPEPTSFTPRLRRLLAEIDPTAILDEAVALDRAVLEARGVVVGAAAGLAVLAVILLGLAASGIYAIMSHAVARRTREIGVRAALGAGPGRILVTIGRRAAVQLAAGTALGMPLAGWLFRLVRDDPGTAPSAVVAAATVPGICVMVLVGGLACTVPLVRALRVTPTEAIRAEA